MVYRKEYRKEKQRKKTHGKQKQTKPYYEEKGISNDVVVDYDRHYEHGKEVSIGKNRSE